jgi:2-iminobutanoate/2-iminopropanoate deaminase
MTARRPRSIEVPGVNHGSVPIPMGARVGNMLFSSGIAGKDPATNKVPPEAAEQARFAFQNLRTLLENGGATLEDVGHVTVFVKDESVRDAINAEWIKCFPDPHDRPARHTLVHELRGGVLLQLEIIAVVQGDRS